MHLWLWYAPGTAEQITEACAKAAQELASRGTTVERAYFDTLDANELPESHVDELTPHAASVAAWYAAEYAALAHLAELTGEWPNQAALIIVSEDR